MSLEIKRNNILLGENIGKVYGIVKYSQDLEYGWLSRITIMSVSQDEELFEKACRKVESRVTSVNCRLRGLSHLKKEGFKQLSPFYSSEKEIENIINRIVPLSTFIGGFPFASSGYNDGTGYYFAKDSSASFPSTLINILFVDADASNLVDDLEKVAIYQDIIHIVDQLNKEWIEEMKKEYSYCDDFEIIYNYDLTWYHLISIDSVKLSQDFRKMNQNEILENALKFLLRTVTVEEREVEEDAGHNNSCSDDCDNIHIEIVRKKIAIITVETRKFEEVLPDVDIIDEEDVLMATNIFNNISSTGGIEGNLNIYDDNIDFGDLQEYSEGHANIPYYNQTDARWGYKSYGNSTIGHGGCGPTSLAMVVSGLTGEKVTPDIVADWSYRNGHRAEGLGSYWSLMTAGGKYYGLSV